MTEQSGNLLRWTPRVLALLVCVFLSVFSLDAFEGAKTFARAIPEFGVHLAPVLILFIVVAVSWRWEWVGGLVFTGLAVGYAYAARTHISWVLIIAGPLLVVGVLFVGSWRQRSRLRAPPPPLSSNEYGS